jgi:hypothetical protein
MGAPKVLAAVGSTPVAVQAGASGWQVSIAPAPGQNGAYQVYDQNQNLLGTIQGNASPYQWTLQQTGDPYFSGQIVGYVSVPSGTMNMLVTDTGTQAVATPQSGGAFASGTITQKNGRGFLTGSTATAYLGLAPVPGADDFKMIEIADTTGHAHTITFPANTLNGTLHIATFNGTIGSVLSMRAYQGVWYINAGTTVVLS